MAFKELRTYQKKERTSSMLCSLPDTFFEDVAKYAAELEENKEYDLLKNVYSITSLIKETPDLSTLIHSPLIDLIKSCCPGIKKPEELYYPDINVLLLASVLVVKVILTPSFLTALL